MSHFQNVCEYGTVHGQCRCASEHKTTRKIDCPTPETCRPKAEANGLPERRRGSLEYLLAEAFNAGIRAQSKAQVQEVPSHRKREFLEREFAEFRNEPFQWVMPGVQPHPPASECGLPACTYPYPHSHGTD